MTPAEGPLRAFDNDALIEEIAYAGNPLRPDMETPTPAATVARLTRPQRFQRVEWLMQQAHDIYCCGMEKHLNNRTVVASCVLYSGGNDSTTLAHLMRGMGLVTHAIHANTTIGIEQTRQFVRDTCAAWDLPLLEKVAPVTYRDLVLERGFPGPGMHWKMYSRLKERALDAARHDLGIANSRKYAAVFIAGRRRQESARRKEVPLWEKDGSVIWVSPIALWTKPDMNTYRLMHPDVPTNEVTDKLHMSGECLCGAFSHKGELDEIGFWFPEVAAEIRALEVDVAAAGHPYPKNQWGHGTGDKGEKVGRLCETCEIPGQTVAFTTETEEPAA